MSHPAFVAGNTAVITGAASGIGLAIARMLATRGLNVVLADRNDDGLKVALGEVRSANPDVEAVTCVADVSKESDVHHLAESAYTTFGSVNVLVNNAAITAKGWPWSGLDQWRHSLAVNFWGVLCGQAAFVPRMIAGGQPGAIVNLGSKEGITTPPGNAAYSVSKAAIKVLTEQLAHELRQFPDGRVTAHLLIPGYTFTPMNVPDMTATSPKPPAAWTADQVACAMWDGIQDGCFYIICPDNEVSSDLDRKRILWAAQDMTEGRPALSRWHPEYCEAFEKLARGGETARDRSAEWRDLASARVGERRGNA